MNNIEILKLTEGFGGEYLTKEIIKRSKDNNIIYLTEDVLLNTKCVQELAQYLENLIQENKELKEHLQKYYNGELFTAKQLKSIEENQKKYFIHKSKVKEKIDKLGIYREKHYYFRKDLSKAQHDKSMKMLGGIEYLQELLQEGE